MPSERSPDVKFEIGHVLFIDIVDYSKLLITEQSERLQMLKDIVRRTEQQPRSEIHDGVFAGYDRPSMPSLIICRPAGDKIPFPVPRTNQIPLSSSRQYSIFTPSLAIA
jgi:hypothetical protein